MNSYEEAIFTLKKLEDAGYEARLAGGCVRDRLCSLTPNDYDVATTATPEQALKVFEKQHTIPTGLQHGTITVVYPNSQVEVTTLRVDKKCDGRHAEIEYTDDWKLDASRRDFTINAMYMDKTGKIYDYFNGQQDLKNNIVKFVGDPEQRIKEDYLRIMRYFRFAARFGDLRESFLIGSPDFAAIIKHASGLRNISQERITTELIKILEVDDAGLAATALEVAEIYKIIFSEYILHPNIASENQLTGEIKLLSFFINQSPNQVEQAGLDLKLPSRIVKFAKFFATRPVITDEPSSALDYLDQAIEIYKKSKIRRSLQNKNKPIETDQAALLEIFLLLYQFTNFKEEADKIEEYIKTHSYLRKQRVPFSSEDLLSLGFKGKDFGKVSKILKRSFRNGDYQSKSEQILKIISGNQSEIALALTDTRPAVRDLAKFMSNYVKDQK